jgi:glyoxylase-like metal-dependent hydrolase (beta-lactamase superfamily II)
MKIYRAELYCGSDSILDYPAHRLQHGDTIEREGIQVEVIGLPGHTGNSLGYKINNMIFSGDALAAGTVGETIHNYAEEVNKDAIRRRILSYEDHYLIFPGHGPPSSVSSEKRFNTFLREAAT